MIDKVLLTCVALAEVVDLEVIAAVQAEAGVLADYYCAGADDPVRLLPDHGRVACQG